MHTFIIAAVAENGVIGKDGNLTWHLPADQAFFFDRIKNAALLTGRTSFESAHGSQTFQDLSKVVILTSQKDYQAGAAVVAHDLNSAWSAAKKMNKAELAVLGGAKVYEQCMEKVDTLIITEIHASFDGDTFFPEINPQTWKETKRQFFQKDKTNPFDFSFVEYTNQKIANQHG